jgi:hypothetical protein
MKNDIAYFKTTHKPGHGILCPSCGGLIKATNKSSFRLTLTAKLSEHFNILLEMLRIHTYQTEVLLRAKASLPPIHKYGEPYAVTDLLYLERLYKSLRSEPKPEDAEQRFKVLKEQVEAWFHDRKKPVESMGRVMSPCGEHIDTLTAKYADLFRMTSDPDDVASRFDELMPSKGEDIDITNPAHVEYLSFLLGTGAEPRVYGLLFDLVAHQTTPVVPLQPDLEQSEPPKWIYLDDFWSMADFFSDENRQKDFIETRNLIIKKVLPHYSVELDRVEKVLGSREKVETRSSEGPPSKDKTPATEDLSQSLDRVRWLLLLLHGHSYAQSQEETDRDLRKRLKPNDTLELRRFTNLFLKDAYLLPLSPNVSVQLASRLLKSRAFLSDFADENWFDTWFKVFEGSDTKPKGFSRLWEKVWSFLTGEDNRNDDFHWLHQIEMVADVSCGHSGLNELPQIAAPGAEVPPAKRVLRNSRKRYQPCKWRIGVAPTSSVVLLGSQATGKSCTFMSGLTRLKECCDSLGLSVEDEDIATKSGLAEYAERLRRKSKPGATQLPQSLRFIINSSKNSGESPGSRVSFVDIPGEFVSTLDDHENARPEVAHLLHSSETIVFCFDIWADKVLNDILLSDKGDGQWKDAEETFREAQKERKDKTAGILIDQPMLLKKLAASLKSLRKTLDGGEVKFICLFTKADLLAEFEIVTGGNRGESAPRQNGKFLSHLFKEWLKNGWLWQDPISRQVQSFAGTTNHEPKIGTDSLQETAEDQIALCRRISDEFKGAMINHSEKMVITPNDSGDPYGMTVKTRVCESIIGFAESVFGKDNCYFLPVSSLGLGVKPSGDADAKNKQSDKPFAPIFAEYAFLLPICLGLSRALNENDSTSSLGNQEKDATPLQPNRKSATSSAPKK